MKCKTCKKQMKPVLVNCDFERERKNVMIINIPAEQCPKCGKIEIFGLIEDKAKRFVLSCDSPIVDYAACEEKENTDAIVAMQILR